MNTPRQLIDWAEGRFIQADLFYGHGTDNALDEAAFLVLGALDMPFDVDPERLNEPVAAAELKRIKELVDDRIKSRRPVAYLLNQAWFAGLSFYVDERVLIPRSPVAELIREEFSPWIKRDEVKNILDIGTGSGCIALACATVFPEAVVDATDVSPDALEVARINCERHGQFERINLVRSDLFEALEDKRYDIIISNPPYVPGEEISTLPAEYRHEPPQALIAGADGLDIISRILLDAHRFMTDRGILVVETGQSRGALEAKYPETPFVWLELEHGGDGVFLLTREDLATILLSS